MKQEITQFDELKAEITYFVAPTLTIAVTDFSSSQTAIEAAKQVKDYQKRIELKRKELTGPLNDQVKRINSVASEISFPLEKSEQHLKSQINAFATKQEEIRQKELRRVEQERRETEARLAKERHEAEMTLKAKQIADEDRANSIAAVFGVDENAPSEESIHKIEQEALAAELELKRRIAEQAHQQKLYDADRANQIRNTRKTWKCEAIDLNKVPREFLKVELNTAAVLAAARGGVTEIPGVRLWQDIQVALGANTRVDKLALFNGS